VRDISHDASCQAIVEENFMKSIIIVYAVLVLLCIIIGIKSVENVFTKTKMSTEQSG
jgi:hypothetical protein